MCIMILCVCLGGNTILRLISHAPATAAAYSAGLTHPRHRAGDGPDSPALRTGNDGFKMFWWSLICLIHLVGYKYICMTSTLILFVVLVYITCY